MSEGLKKFFKISFPIGLGLLIVFFFYKNLDAKDIASFQSHLKDANYWWVLAAVFVTFLSHLSRAWRWKMMIASLGYTISFKKAFYSLFVNYLVNLGIPRTGEIARCAVLKQYNQIPFDKSFGSLINERIIDVIMLGLVGLSIVIFQYDVFIDFSKQFFIPFAQQNGLLDNYHLINLFALAAFVVLVLIIVLIKKNKFPMQAKFASLFKGIKEGVVSITRLKNPFEFVAHSLFIWLMYWLMTYIICFAIPGGEAITLMASLAVLFFGTFAFIIVSGGLGAYPVAMGIVLSLYGIDALIGNAAGWLLWGGQTIMILFFGALSFFMLSLEKENKKQKG